MNKRIIDTASYGIALFSIDTFMDFLRKNKIKKKKLTNFFDDNNHIFKQSLKEGAWIPIAKIHSIEYELKILNKSEEFDKNWTEVFSHDDFNLKVSDDSAIWICDISYFNKWDPKRLSDRDSVSYETLDGETLFNAFRIEMSQGTYKVSIKGYKNNKVSDYVYGHARYGFLLDFKKTEPNTFESFNDPLALEVNPATK